MVPLRKKVLKYGTPKPSLNKPAGIYSGTLLPEHEKCTMCWSPRLRRLTHVGLQKDSETKA